MKGNSVTVRTLILACYARFIGFRSKIIGMQEITELFQYHSDIIKKTSPVPDVYQ